MKKTIVTAAIAAAIAGSMAGAGIADAAYLGGADFGGWCRTARGGLILADATPRNGSDAWSWRCTYVGITTAFPVDYNATCKWQYHDQRAWGKPLDGHNAWSWRCYN